jgi:porin
VLRIKIGKVDANSEFDRTVAALEFIHQSTGSSATLFTLPTYPDPAMSVNVFVKPMKNLQVGFGVYDGSYANGVRTGDVGPRNFFRNTNDLFLIGEVDQSWTLGKEELAGRLGVGGWYNTNRFARFDGGQDSGTGAPFALLEQAIWRANPHDDRDVRGVSAFVMYGYADPVITVIDHNIGGGIAWIGPLPSRPTDVCGFGVQAAHFSDSFAPGDQFEVSYETFYRLQIKPWFSITPDIQYVSNPGGRGTPDALAVTLRFLVVF